jgi:hypothetical protein
VAFNNNPEWASLDRTGQQQTGRAHYGINIDKIFPSYCYIYKTACTAFENLFLDKSQRRRLAWKQHNPGIKLLSSCQRLIIRKAQQANIRIMAYRGPSTRPTSLFRNKFIRQKYCDDIFANHQMPTSKDPGEANFRSLVNGHVQRVCDRDEIDRHLYTQTGHSKSIDHNTVICVDNLYASTGKLLSEDIGNLYFSTSANPSSSSLSAQGTSSIYIADTRASKLQKLFQNETISLKSQRLLEDILPESIHKIYAEDLGLSKRIERIRP